MHATSQDTSHYKQGRLILKIPYCDVFIAIALVGIRTGQILREKEPAKQSINSVDGIL